MPKFTGESIDNFGTSPVSTEFPRIALYETFALTAVFLVHGQTGNLLVTENIGLEAIAKVEQFCDTYGLGRLVYIYRLLTAYDNLNALNHSAVFLSAIFC